MQIGQCTELKRRTSNPREKPRPFVRSDQNPCDRRLS
jgi:hypothetical protein